MTTLPQTLEKLHVNNVLFTTESFFSGFWGTRLVFETHSSVRHAQKVLGKNALKKHFKQWCIEFY
jgi:hypothetical protein